MATREDILELLTLYNFPEEVLALKDWNELMSLKKDDLNEVFEQMDESRGIPELSVDIQEIADELGVTILESTPEEFTGFDS